MKTTYSKETVSNFKISILFILCFSFGLSMYFSIFDETVTQRDPASFGGKVYQISSLSSEQIKAQLNNKIRVQPTVDGKKSLRLEGFSSALCKNYETVELQFVADGFAVAGEPTEMIVKTPCEAGQDPAEMASIQIPVGKITSEKPRNAEFHYDGFTSKFKFSNISENWPTTWVLKTVSFKSKTGKNKVVHLDKNENGDIVAKSPSEMIVLEF